MKRSRAQPGFTFVEILAALVFLGILMPVVVSALTLSNSAAVIAERTSAAVRLGENRLNELTLADAWTSAETRGEFGPEWPGYRWELSRADWEAGDMTELAMNVFFQVQGREHVVHLSTLVSEAVSQAASEAATTP